MTTFKSSQRIIHNPCTVIAAPTSLTAGATGEYGGSIIGSTRAVELLPLGTPFRVECEGLGEFSDVLEANNRWVAGVFLRGWDKAAVQNILAGGYAAGATTGNAKWSVPGSRTPGQSATGRALVWLFAPDDPEIHPALIIRAGIPDFSDGARVAFQHGEELGIAFTIECLRNGSGATIDMGMLADLTL